MDAECSSTLEETVMESRIETLERTTTHHQELIEKLWTQVNSNYTDIKSELSAIKATMFKLESPGNSPWCQQHVKALEGYEARIKAMEIDIRGLQLRQALWTGGLTVLLFISTLFGPMIRSALHLDTVPHSSVNLFQPAIKP